MTIKFEIHVTDGNHDWWEPYSEWLDGSEEVEPWAKALVDKFNKTLRPGQLPRTLLEVKLTPKEKESWIDKNPEATREQRVAHMAGSIVGTCSEPTAHTLEWYGLEEDFDIVEESYEICAIFDENAMRCNTCDWWCDPSELDEDGNCGDCR